MISKRTIVVLIMLAVVGVVLAGGTAFIIQQNRLAEFRRAAAQAQEKAEAKEYPEAITLLQKVESRGGTAQSATLLGRIYYEQGRTADAIKLFDRVLKNYGNTPYTPEAMLYKARYAQEIEGKQKAAKQQYLEILDKHRNSAAADFALVYLARMSYEEGDVRKAKTNLDVVIKKGDSPARNDAEMLVGNINMKMLLSPQPGPNDEVYTIKRGDSIWKLERALKVPGDLIVGINKLKPSALTVGQQIKVPRLDIAISIEKPQRMLVVRNNGTFLKKYQVGINQNDSRVPAGDFTISSKYEKGYEFVDPDTNTTFKAGDPANPLGTRFLQLRRDMGIHGTNDPDSIGKYIAKGYIAMRNEDIEELYTIVRAGGSGSPGTPALSRVVISRRLSLKSAKRDVAAGKASSNAPKKIPSTPPR